LMICDDERCFCCAGFMLGYFIVDFYNAFAIFLLD